MKKILGAALALSLIGSAAFAEITVSGRGYVETHVFNYATDANGENGTTKLFDNWDTGDSDVFISGDINGIAGAMLNIDFGDAAKSDSATPVKVGDWNVWIKPLDFLTIKASNEANRVANRYNGIIDKTESKWGTLKVATAAPDVTEPDFDPDTFMRSLWYSDTANDDDSFKGYQVNLDFSVVKVDLGFNKSIQANGFTADSMTFANAANEIGFGARVVVPVEGLLNVDAFFKMYMKDDKNANSNDKNNMTFGAIFDIVAINNMGLAIGYIGHYDEVGLADGVFTSAVDVRFQYNLADNMGIALHNNATFDSKMFADKVNLGFMYGLTDVATLYIEAQNYLYSPNVGYMQEIITVYPRFAFAVAEGVTMKTGLRADFGAYNNDLLEIALPFSMEVIF